MGRRVQAQLTCGMWGLPPVLPGHWGLPDVWQKGGAPGIWEACLGGHFSQQLALLHGLVIGT